MKYALSRKLLPCKRHLARRNPSPNTGVESLNSGVNESYTLQVRSKNNTQAIRSVVVYIPDIMNYSAFKHILLGVQ